MKDSIIQTTTKEGLFGGRAYAALAQVSKNEVTGYGFIDDYSEIDESLAEYAVRDGMKLTELEAIGLGLEIPKGFSYKF